MEALSSRNKSLRGIQVRNYKQINTTLFCELCRFLLLHPSQLLCCGTRLCRWCAKSGLSTTEPFICPFCHKHQAHKQDRADRGVERELNMVTCECHACSWTGSYRQYVDHLQEHHAVFECDDCEACFSTVNSTNEHREEVCEQRKIRCGLSGCVEEVKRCDLAAHYVSGQHQILLIEFLLAYFTSRNQISDDYCQALVSLTQRSDNLFPGLEVLSDGCTRLRLECDEGKTACEQLILQMGETAIAMNEIDDKMNRTGQLQNDMSKELDDMKKVSSSIGITLLDSASKAIFPFTVRRDDINSSFSITSPIFKTTISGYSFIIRLCSTVDAQDDNQPHLSIFISLLPGEYDAILFFPFPYSIYLYLYDQSGSGKHVVSAITSGSDSPLFGRPTSEKKSEAGIVKFCPMSDLSDANSIYLKDHQFFVGVFVDFLDSRAVLF